MKATLRFLAVLCLVSLFTSPLRAQNPDVDRFFEEFTAEWVRGDPNLATSTRYFSGAEQDALEQQVTPQTGAYFVQRAELAANGLKRLNAFDRASMSPAQRLSADILKWNLENTVEEQKWRDFLFPIQPNTGANIILVDALTVRHPLRTAKDAENYLARLAQLGMRMDEARAEAERMARGKFVPPRFILRATVEQLGRFIESPPDKNPLVSTLAEKIASINDLAPAQREKLLAEARKILSTQVLPSWRKSIALLEGLATSASDDAGVWKFPRGAEAYAYFLRANTTTQLTAEEIHKIGLREVARIESEMDAIFRRLGRSTGSLQERIDQLKLDQAYKLDEAGREQIITDANQIVRDAEKRAATMFLTTPKATVSVQPWPAYQDDTMEGQYTSPSLDGSRPAVVRIPRRPNRMTRFGQRTLMYHEGIPGHHYQIATQLEDEKLPGFRRNRAFGNITAFIEGWGLYAERLAVDEGWYDDDLEGRLGQLDAELFRARRLVVDTGLHAMKWTRQQAIDYGIEPSEVDRYVVRPGQACAYMIGQLKFIELRERARKELGDQFDIKQYHKLVLDIGTAPLSIVEQQVDEWIARTNAP